MSESDRARPKENDVTEKSRRPNILFLLTDQQRSDTVAALGNPQIRTPVLNRLACEGTAFTRAYTPSPVCVSARCALITGQSPHRTGCTDNMPMPQNLPSFMEHLQSGGYQTHGVGKMHFTPDHRRMWGFDSRDIADEMKDGDFRQFLNDNGFVHVDEPNGMRSEYYYIPQPSQLPAHLHHTAWVADRSRAFLERRDRNRPFFLWSSFIKPHPPFETPTPWNKLYRAAEMPLPFRPEGHGDLLTYWNRVQNRYKYRDAGHDDWLLRTMRAAYYASITFIDYNIGRILESLGDEIDNTLILFTSDHGELLGDYGSVGKRCMLDAACRVPMLARFPEVFPAGRRCDTPTTLLDILPTFLAAAQQEIPACDGQNLAVLARDGGGGREVTSQFQAGALGTYMLASRTQKYVYSAPDRKEWLFDAVADPQESRNLAENPMYVETVRTMRTRLITRLREDDYTEPLDGDGWRLFPRPGFPTNPDGGVLFQDPPNTAERVASLGSEYARPVVVAGKDAASILSPELEWSSSVVESTAILTNPTSKATEKP